MGEFDESWEGKDTETWHAGFVDSAKETDEEVAVKQVMWRDWDDGEKISGVYWDIDTPDACICINSRAELAALAIAVVMALGEGH